MWSMKYKTDFLIAMVSLILVLSACNSGSQREVRFPQMTGASDDKMACLYAPDLVDMGVFDYKTPIKTTEIEFGNIGNATLVVSSVVAECECTKILSVDSIVQPMGKGKIVVSLDMTGYMNDTIYKPIYVISSDPDKHVYTIDLMADNHM